MDTLSEFFHMGGYAFYVWTSYALVAVLLVVNLWIPVARGRRLQQKLRMMLRDTRPSDGRP
jgi:heme exporter protein D